MVEVRKNTVMPTIAGILTIISGSFKIFGLLGLFVASIFVPVNQGFGFAPNISIVIMVIAFFMAIVGILAIVGGVFAIQRKHFGWAVTGSIVAFLPFSLLGLASIILISLSKDEFA